MYSIVYEQAHKINQLRNERESLNTKEIENEQQRQLYEKRGITTCHTVTNCKALQIETKSMNVKRFRIEDIQRMMLLMNY